MTPRHFGILGPIRQNCTFLDVSFIYQNYQPSIDFQYVAEILTPSNQCILIFAEHMRFDDVIKE